jgi:aspartate/methionine/tyrosine aminotransferase
MEPEIANSVELLSLHSVSKGVTGESGLRGGYIETHNIDPEIEAMMYKLRSINLCSNTVGQIAMTLMVDPPQKGRESDETVEQFNKEYKEIFDGHKLRSMIMTSQLNIMENVTCTPFYGALYAFPRIHLSQKAINEANRMGYSPDYFYCLKLLHETGIQVVPGMGFG